MLPTLLLLAALPGADAEPAKVLPPVLKFTGLTAGGTLGFEVANPNADPLPYFGYTRDSYTPPIGGDPPAVPGGTAQGQGVGGGKDRLVRHGSGR